MRITFLRDEIFESEGRLSGPEFPEGCVVDCTQEFGERWIHRGAAEMIDEKRLPKSGERWEIVSFGEARPRSAAPRPSRKPEPVTKAKAAPVKPARPPRAAKPAADDAADKGQGADTAASASGHDTVSSASGADTVTSTSGLDTVSSASGADTVTSSGGADTVSGGAAQDQLNL